MEHIKLHSDFNSAGLMQNKLQKLKDASEVLNAMSDDKKEGIEKAARGFESMFVHMLMKSMKSAMLKKDKDSDMGLNTTPLMEYTDMLLSDEISKSGKGIGIAEMIYKQMTGGDELKSSVSNLKDESIAQQLNNIAGEFKIDKNSFLGKVSDRIKNYQGIINDAAQNSEFHLIS
jgi:Rod binding domain-containing protein